MSQGFSSFTVRLPVEVYERLRQRAFDDRTSQSKIVVEGVERELDRRDDDAEIARRVARGGKT